MTCKECNKRLDSTSLTERNNEAYCKTCYGKLFGPKGYGFGSGSGVLSTDSTITAEQQFPANPASSISPSTSYTSLTGSNSNLDAASHGAEKVKVASAFTTATSVGGNCPRCGKQVYFAEQVLGPGQVWIRPTWPTRTMFFIAKVVIGFGYGSGAGTLTQV
ncbi:Cysteine and glycine-rich protein 1 [Blyttiomyces sp. JEL0837]|nr:Cysteine and glycine-rich protein 1 [Blyttiomyces sp. JEL0837]